MSNPFLCGIKYSLLSFDKILSLVQNFFFLNPISIPAQKSKMKVTSVIAVVIFAAVAVGVPMNEDKSQGDGAMGKALV